MSTPFPTEEASQTNNAEPVWNPWKGPAQPSWYSGMGFTEDTAYAGPAYRALEAAGSGAAKGEAVLGGLLTAAGRVYSSVGTPRVVGKELEPIGADIQAEARERVKAMTPDPATTGSAVSILHGVVEGGYLLTAGSVLGSPAGGAAMVGGVEGGSRYQELREQGVDRGTAAAAGGVTAVTAGVGAFLPAAYGSTLLARLATGAGANTGFGIVNRFADHQLLEAGGYSEMAAQQKVFDGTQMLVDAALGATFGGIHHLSARDPQKQDAAMTANLALRDRQSAPGVATDPEAANAHQAALEKAQADLLQRKPVDVSDTNVDRAAFLSRPTRDLTPENEIILKSFKESGLLDEEANLRELEAQFSKRIGQVAPERESVKPAAEPGSDAYSVQEEALTDEQREAFQGLRSDVQTDQELGGRGEGVPAGRGGEDDGGAGATHGEPLTVYRGSDRELVPEHFGPESLGKASEHPSSGLGVYFTSDAEDAARYGTVTAHHLDVRNPKVIGPGELPAFDSIEDATKFRDQLRTEGHDGITLDYSSVGGPVQHVAFEPHQVFPAERATPVHQSVIKPRWHVGDEPIWEMSPQKLEQASETLKSEDIETLKEAFGSEEEAGIFARLADSNSDKAYDKAERMVQALSPEKRAIIEKWERGGGPTLEEMQRGAKWNPPPSPEELRSLSRDVGEISGAESPSELVQFLKYAITKMGEHDSPENMNLDELSAMMQLKEGYRLAVEKGWDARQISDETIRAAAKRFSDPEDAAFMLRRYMKPKTDSSADPVAQVLQENPVLQIADQSGLALDAAGALEATKSEDDWFTATKAAVDCFSRRGG